MDDGKIMATVFISLWLIIGAIVIFGDTENTEKVKLEREKTKQLMIQYKIDSLNALKINIK